jgi:predicted dehydrogenase
MNIVLIGFGYWGKNMARAIKKNISCKLFGIVDNNQKQLDDASKIYFGIKFFNSYLDILSEKEVDAVVIATPVYTHAQLAFTFLNAKKHVLCEKALSTNSEEVENLIKIAIDNNRILMVGYTFLYNSIVIDIKKRIESKQLGKLYYATFKRTGLGPIRNDVDVITDLAVHDISIAIFWFGMPCWAKCIKQDVFKNGNADIAFIQLGYSTGFIVNIHVSWINPMKQREVEVIGERQMLVFDDVSTTEKLKVINKGNDYFSKLDDFGSFQLSIKDGDILIPNIYYPEPLTEEINSFLEQIQTQKINHEKLNIAKKVAKILEMLNNNK